MAKANQIKLRKHAPYRKSFLIPLWILQLLLSLGIIIWQPLSFTIFIFTGILLDIDAYNDYTYPTEWQIVVVVIHMLLNLLLTSSIIVVITEFSRYTLTTKFFKIQSIIAVVLSGSCIVVYLATMDWYFAIFPGIAWLASIAICARVCVLRKRVLRGDAAEMKRKTAEVDGEEAGLDRKRVQRGEAAEMKRRTMGVDVEEAKLEDGDKFRGVKREGVELEDGNKFRGVESEVTIMSVAHHVPRLL